MPFFSIVVPVFNAELFLDKCIQSVLQQSFSDFELLLIDDGSVDKSYSICLNWAKRDLRVRVFHQENRGAGSARNLGIRHACGSYIQFLDSDDTIEFDCLQTLYELLCKFNYPDFVEFRLNYFGPHSIHNVQGTTLPDGLYNRDFITEKFLPVMLQIHQDDTLYYGIFNVLRVIRRELIIKNKIQFSETILRWEDWLFAIEVFSKARNMGVTSSALYNYYGHENGGLGGRYNPDTYKYLIETYQTIDDLLGNQYDTLSEYSKKCRIAQFERCIREIFKFEPVRSRKEILEGIIRSTYFVMLICSSSQKKGLFILRPWLTFHSTNSAYNVLSAYIYLTTIRHNVRKKLSQLYHRIMKE